MYPYTPPPLVVQSKPTEVSQIVDCWCVSYAAKKGIKVPIGWNAEDFRPNTTPHPGALALFKYRNGISHVAPILSVSEKGFVIDQDGVSRCNHPTNFVPWDDRNLVGFWEPTATTSALITLD